MNLAFFLVIDILNKETGVNFLSVLLILLIISSANYAPSTDDVDQSQELKKNTLSSKRLNVFIQVIFNLLLFLTMLLFISLIRLSSWLTTFTLSFLKSLSCIINQIRASIDEMLGLPIRATIAMLLWPWKIRPKR